MSMIDATRRTTDDEHDFYQTLPCQIKCLCEYLDLNDKHVLDAGSGMGVISKQLRKSFPKVKLETSEKNFNNPSDKNIFFDFDCASGIGNEEDFPKADFGDFLEVKGSFDCVISNPPYSQKDAFIKHALEISKDVFMLFPLQVLNYISFCQNWLDNESYCGRILMYPKVILNPEGEYRQGGNTGYAWFHWTSIPKEDYQGPDGYEAIEDIRKYK